MNKINNKIINDIFKIIKLYKLNKNFIKRRENEAERSNKNI